MIATYVENNTKNEVYVQDFTAKIVSVIKGGKEKTEDAVIFQKSKGYDTTLIMTKKTFNTEYTKK